MKRMLCSAALAGAAAMAQPPAPPAPPAALDPLAVNRVFLRTMQAPGADVMSMVGAEFAFEMQLVKGAPFTADFVTEAVQTLADGNRIVNKRTESYARDGEGRTRREMPVSPVGPFANGDAPRSVFIHDPVAGIDWILEPGTRTARKVKIPQMRIAQKLASIQPSGGENITISRGPVPAIASTTFPAAGLAQTFTTKADQHIEQLGKRVIEGIQAEGVRTTMTLPAGAVGNERPLVTVSERWYSDELKTTVMTLRNDPRTGENTYKATNLRRGEPGPQLFEPPADYTIVDDSGPMIRNFVYEKK